MKTKAEHLIKELVSDLKPVKVVRFQSSDLFKVIAVGLLCMFTTVTILGLRLDIGEQVLMTKFLFDTGILFLLGFFSILAAFSLSVPSLNARNIYRLPLFVFGLILLTASYSFIATSNPFMYFGHGFPCVFEMISISILPTTILFYFIFRMFLCGDY